MAEVDVYLLYLIHMSYTGYFIRRMIVKDQNITGFNNIMWISIKKIEFFSKRELTKELTKYQQSMLMSIYQCRFNYKLS